MLFISEIILSALSSPRLLSYNSTLQLIRQISRDLQTLLKCSIDIAIVKVFRIPLAWFGLGWELYYLKINIWNI